MWEDEALVASTMSAVQGTHNLIIPAAYQLVVRFAVSRGAATGTTCRHIGEFATKQLLDNTPKASCRESQRTHPKLMCVRRVGGNT